jgi:hypothetical protein
MIRVQSWLLTAKGLAPNLVPGKIAKRAEKSVLAPESTSHASGQG